MVAVTVGQNVRLKPERAEAYGLEAQEIYRVSRVYTKSGYKALWLELEGGEMVAPFNQVKATEVRS